MLRERSSNIASFIEHPVCSVFKMYSVLILVFWFWYATTNPNCMCKSHLLLKFQVLHEGSNVAASSMEHPVYSIFKMHRVLIYSFIYVLPGFTLSECVEVNFSWNFRCSGKGDVILLRSWSTLYIAISKHAVSQFELLFFWFVTIHPKWMCRSHFFLKF